MSYTRTESTDGTFSADDDLNLIPVGRTRTTWNRPQWLHAVTGRCNLQTLFFLLDQLISGVLLAPLVIAYWRGTWVLLAGCIYPDEPYKAGWLLFSIANTGLLLLVLFQQQIEVYIRRNSFNAYCDVVVWVVCYHGYTYIAGILAVSQWQGIQLLLNYYTGNDLYSNGYAVILSLVLLMMLRCVKTCVAAPCYVSIDTVYSFFKQPTRFSADVKKRELWWWDCFLTVLVIHNLRWLYWRSFFQLLDENVLEHKPIKSAWLSVAMGYAAFICLIPIQLIGHSSYKAVLKSNYRGVTRQLLQLILEDGSFLLGNAAAVAIWRGIWTLFNIYVWPESPMYSGMLTHLTGIVGLWFLNAGHSVLPRGCLLDGEAHPKNGCMFPNLYFRYFFSEQIEPISPQEIPNREIPISAEITDQHDHRHTTHTEEQTEIHAENSDDTNV